MGRRMHHRRPPRGHPHQPVHRLLHPMVPTKQRPTPPLPRTSTTPHPPTRTIPNRTHRRQSHPRSAKASDHAPPQTCNHVTHPPRIRKEQNPTRDPNQPNHPLQHHPHDLPVTPPPVGTPSKVRQTRPFSSKRGSGYLTRRDCLQVQHPHRAAATPPTPNEGVPRARGKNRGK